MRQQPSIQIEAEASPEPAQTVNTNVFPDVANLVAETVTTVRQETGSAISQVAAEVSNALFTQVPNSLAHVQQEITQNLGGLFAPQQDAGDQKVDEFEAPVPSAPQPSPVFTVAVDHPYYEQNQALVNMGFSDEHRNMHMLAQSDGNLQRAITMLVENANNL